MEAVIVELVRTNNASAIDTMVDFLPGFATMKYGNDIPLIHAAFDFTDPGLKAFQGLALDPPALSESEARDRYKKINADFATLNTLIKGGALVTEEAPHGSFAARAIEAEDIRLIEWLYSSSGINPNTAILPDGGNSFHAAALTGNPEVFKVLMKFSKSVDDSNNQGHTPLSVLMIHSKNYNLSDIEKISEMLILGGAHPNPIIKSDYLDVKIPLSYEMEVCRLARGDGHAYAERLKMLGEEPLSYRHQQDGISLEKFVVMFQASTAIHRNSPTPQEQ